MLNVVIYKYNRDYDIDKELWGDCINWLIIIDNLVIGYFLTMFLLAIYSTQFKKWGNMSKRSTHE